MTLPNHIGAYTVEIETFESASADLTGIRVYYGKNEGEAKKFQLRLHQARALNRQENARLYPRDDMRHGHSPYDNLVVRVREDVAGDWWVYLEKRIFDPERIESLTPATEATDGQA